MTKAPPKDEAENIKYFIQKLLVDQWPKMHYVAETDADPKTKPVKKKDQQRPTSRTATPSHRPPPDDIEEDEDEHPCLYPHFMCANDTSIVERVFENTKDVIIQAAISNLAFV